MYCQINLHWNLYLPAGHLVKLFACPAWNLTCPGLQDKWFFYPCIYIYTYMHTYISYMFNAFCPLISFQYIGTLDVPRPSSRVEIVAAMRRIRVSLLCLHYLSRSNTWLDVLQPLTWTIFIDKSLWMIHEMAFKEEENIFRFK